MTGQQITTISLLIIWLITGIVAWAKHDKFANGKGFLLAWCCWPLLCINNIVSLWSADNAGIVGFALSLTAIPLVFLGCYTLVYAMTVQQPMQGKWRYWAASLALPLSALPLVLVDVDIGAAWLGQAPTGQPLLFWVLYVPELLAMFVMLVCAIALTELIQRYHYLLPEQVVDVHLYEAKSLGKVAGLCVGVSFALITLVTVVGFGFFSMPYWLTLIHTSIAASVLIVMLLLLKPHNTSASPINYSQPQAGENELKRVLALAERAVINNRAYKEIGLTIEKFAQQASLSPTLLSQALSTDKKRHFRGFIFHYRLEYAKKVLLRSDAQVASVAKRLGLGSEKFLSGAFIKYMEKGKPQG